MKRDATIEYLQARNAAYERFCEEFPHSSALMSCIASDPDGWPGLKAEVRRLRRALFMARTPFGSPYGPPKAEDVKRWKESRGPVPKPSNYGRGRTRF
jgi:hypothetical protein